jgi:hypothetical protein
MLETASLTCPQPRRRISSSRKRDKVSNDMTTCKHRDCRLTALDLVWYCDKEKVPYRTFNNYSDILAVMKDIVGGKVSVEEAAKGEQATSN